MSSLAIVEKKPPFAGGCAGGVLFHLLDWHRRLARKRRLFSPRRLLPSSLRSASSPRRLPAPPSPAPSQPPPAPRARAVAAVDDGAAPGVVARLMGLESWPAAVGAAGAPPRPQKQRKVEAMPLPRVDESAVVVVLPPSRRPPVPEHEYAPAPAPRSHHAADLPARSPRRSRLVHAAAAKLLEPGARASSRASARLALAYACSSPQHRMDGHSGGEVERSTRVQPPLLPADAEWDNAITSRRQDQHSINNIASTAAVGLASSNTVLMPRSDFDDADRSTFSSDVDAMHKDHRVTSEGMTSCARIRSNGSGTGIRAGEERWLRKRGTPSRPEVAGSVRPGSLVSSTRPAGSSRELISGSRRTSYGGSCPRRELGSVTPQPQRSARRDVIDRSGSTSTSRSAGNASGPKRGSRKKVGRDTTASNRDVSNSVAFASSSSMRPVARASSYSKASEKRGCRSTRVSDTACERISAADAKFIETSPSVAATSEKEEFSRLLKAKVNELGLSHRVESSDALSGKLTASLLQELISALTNDTNTSASQDSNFSDSSAPLNNDGAIRCSNDQSPDFQNCYQRNKQVDSSATCASNEPNQPSPTSVLEACFSNDTSSLGSPTEKTEGKELFESIGHKMEDFFNLESDIVDLAMSVDATKPKFEGSFHGSGKVTCAPNFAGHDFKFLEARLHSIGEAISNAELLLGSSLLCSATPSLRLHYFIFEMLETVVDLFGGSESLGLTEEKKYQRINFLFDCVVESLDSKFCNFGKCGYNAWLRLPLTLNKGILKREISEEIGNWRETRETAPNQAAEKELEQVTPRWDKCQVEAFDISIAIENDILEGLVDEFTFDQWLI